jgi:hypothetical protein
MTEKSNSLTREFLAERDLRIFKMRQAGVPHGEIARRFSITTKAVTSAISRQLEKLNQEALLAYPEVLRMELERLDALQQAIWPMTQHRKVTQDDGTEVQIEPDLKAITSVLSIMDRRAKLLGMDQQSVNVNVDIGERIPARAVLAGALPRSAAQEFSPESEARKLLELMGKSGVMPADYVDSILNKTKQLENIQVDDDIVDAEVVDERFPNE